MEKKKNGLEENSRVHLEQMEAEAKALEEADAKAVAAAREKKRLRQKKARRRKILIVSIIIAVIAIGAGGFYLRKKQKEAEENTTVEVVAEAGQEIVYGKITQMYGNEMTYTVLQEMEQRISQDSQPQKGNSEKPENMSIPEGGSMPENMENMVMTQSGIFEETGETAEVMIQVGTDVITKLGSTTTFSRLGTDDIIAIVYDGEDIVRIYIIG